MVGSAAAPFPGYALDQCLDVVMRARRPAELIFQPQPPGLRRLNGPEHTQHLELLHKHVPKIVIAAQAGNQVRAARFTGVMVAQPGGQEILQILIH
jgi:hypothetical protein